MDIKLVVINILTSGIVAALITFFLNKNKEEKRYKKLLLDDVVGYSYQITENFKGDKEDFLHAVNRVFIVYNSDKKVIECLKKYKDESNSKNLLYLIKEMSEVAGISHKQILDTFLLEPFVEGGNQKNKKEDYSDLY